MDNPIDRYEAHEARKRLEESLKYYRFDLKTHQHKELIEMINTLKDERTKNSFLRLFADPKIINFSMAKYGASLNANKAKTDKSEKLVRNAIRILKANNEKINIVNISKTAKISYNTSKKYFKLLNIN